MVPNTLKWLLKKDKFWDFKKSLFTKSFVNFSNFYPQKCSGRVIPNMATATNYPIYLPILVIEAQIFVAVKKFPFLPDKLIPTGLVLSFIKCRLFISSDWHLNTLKQKITKFFPLKIVENKNDYQYWKWLFYLREREQKVRIVTGFIFGHSIQIMMTHEKKF